MLGGRDDRLPAQVFEQTQVRAEPARAALAGVAIGLVVQADLVPHLDQPPDQLAALAGEQVVEGAGRLDEVGGADAERRLHLRRDERGRKHVVEIVAEQEHRTLPRALELAERNDPVGLLERPGQDRPVAGRREVIPRALPLDHRIPAVVRERATQALFELDAGPEAEPLLARAMSGIRFQLSSKAWL